MPIKVCKGVTLIKTNLKEIRRQKGISQAELAKLSGVSRNTIIKIETGDEVIVSTDTIEKISKALNANPVDIFSL